MNTDEKLKAVIDDMDNWDLETLLGWAQQEREAMLRNAGEKAIECEYDILIEKF